MTKKGIEKISFLSLVPSLSRRDANPATRTRDPDPDSDGQGVRHACQTDRSGSFVLTNLGEFFVFLFFLEAAVGLEIERLGLV